jgi:hypothetical protein
MFNRLASIVSMKVARNSWLAIIVMNVNCGTTTLEKISIIAKTVESVESEKDLEKITFIARNVMFAWPFR